MRSGGGGGGSASDIYIVRKQERSELARVKNGRKDKKKRATAIKQTKGER